MSDRIGSSLLSNASLFELSPLHVDEGGRIGFLHEDKAAALGRLMAVDGQRDPIKVVANPQDQERPWKLVTGMHRLIGARIEGITVWAIEVAGKPEDLVDLEASENLHRRPLTPLERAKFTAALVQAAQARIAREHGKLTHQQLGIKKRWAKVKAGEIRAEQALKDETDDTSATIAQVYGWEESVSEALGMSKRTIHYDLTLYRLLIEPFPDLTEALSNHPVVGENAAQLKQVASVRSDAKRREVIELLLADPELSAPEAMVQVGIAVAGSRGDREADRQEGQTKYLTRAESNLDLLTPSVWKSWAPALARKVQPSALVTVRDAMSARIKALRAEGTLREAFGVDDLDPSDLQSALKDAFGIIGRLAQGDAVDDDELNAAARTAQHALFGIPLDGEADDAR